MFMAQSLAWDFANMSANSLSSDQMSITPRCDFWCMITNCSNDGREDLRHAKMFDSAGSTCDALWRTELDIMGVVSASWVRRIASKLSAIIVKCFILSIFADLMASCIPLTSGNVELLFSGKEMLKLAPELYLYIMEQAAVRLELVDISDPSTAHRTDLWLSSARDRLEIENDPLTFKSQVLLQLLFEVPVRDEDEPRVFRVNLSLPSPWSGKC